MTVNERILFLKVVHKDRVKNDSDFLNVINNCYYI